METLGERARFVNSSIPIEIVDDDELAAIETAFCRISSVQCSPNFASAPPLPPRRSLAESANYWLTQCSNVQERVRNPESGTFSVPLLQVHTVLTTALKAEGQRHSSCCCRSHESKATLVSSPSAGFEKSNAATDGTRTTADSGHLQGQTNEVAIPVVQDIEDLPSEKDAVKSEQEGAPPEPKPRCLSVTDFTAFVRTLFAAYNVVVIFDFW